VVTKNLHSFLLPFLVETLTMIRSTMFGEHSTMSSEIDWQNRHRETKLSTKVNHPLKGGKFENKEMFNLCSSSSTRVVKFI